MVNTSATEWDLILISFAACMALLGVIERKQRASLERFRTLLKRLDAIEESIHVPAGSPKNAPEQPSHAGLLAMEREENLLYLADLTVADYIVRVQRMKIARKRTQMWMGDERHMCLEDGCYEPVFGKVIFAHCEAHLGESEKSWAEEDLETNGFSARETSTLRNFFDETDRNRIEENKKAREGALDKAFKLENEYWAAFNERRNLLPKALLHRLEHFEIRLCHPDID
jgi:hypothetical protein